MRDWYDVKFCMNTLFAKIKIAGYGNFHPETRAGQIISMAYAFCGIPILFTIMLEWGFLYFTWLEMFWKWFNQKVFSGSQEALLRKRLEQEKYGFDSKKTRLQNFSMFGYLGPEMNSPILLFQIASSRMSDVVANNFNTRLHPEIQAA